MVWVQKNFNLAWRNTSNNQKNVPAQDLRAGKAQLIKKIVERSNSIKHTSVVIRLSSLIIENKTLLSKFAENLEILADNGLNLIVVHEYGNLLTKQLKLLGIDEKKYSPHFGDDQLSGLFEMVISGHINKRIVSKLCSLGVLAVGLSGKDGNLLVAKKSNHIAITGSWLYSTEPLLVNPEVLLAIEDTKIVPIISPVTCTEKGKTAILDAEITSAMIAAAVNASKLIIMCEDDFLVNKVGVLSSVAELNYSLNSTIEVTVTDPLVKASKYALLNSDITVQFVDARKNNALLFAIFD